MYANWCSTQEEIQMRCVEQESLLTQFPPETANIMATQAVLSLKVDCACSHNPSNVVAAGGALSGSVAASQIISSGTSRDNKDSVHQNPVVANPFSVVVNSDQHVAWAMQMINYGLTMQFSYWDVVKHSAHIYCTWLRCLLPNSDDVIIPDAIRRDPNRYSQAMLMSLCRLFMPRQWRSTSSIAASGERKDKEEPRREEFTHSTEQPTALHAVLRTIEEIANESRLINTETWECILQFLLAVNHIMLGPPPEIDDLSFKMADRMVGVMFSVWLLACQKCFPRPSLWKTFSEMSRSWRHHESLILQWNTANAALTNRLLKILYGKQFPDLPSLDDSAKRLVPKNLSDECVKEVWFRFLHLLGNPVDLCHPKTIANTDDFQEMKNISHSRVKQSLQRLPHIFFISMRGVAILVDAFLGLVPSPSAAATLNSTSNVLTSPSNSQVTSSPSESRRAVGSTVQITGIVANQLPAPNSATSSNVPNSLPSGPRSSVIMTQPLKKHKQSSSQNTHTIPSTTTPTSTGLTMESISGPHPLRPEGNSLLHLFGAWLFEAAITGVKHDMDNSVISNRASKADFVNNHLGRAEACGALCRIFCNSQRDGIQKLYLARFYMCMYFGLETTELRMSPFVLSTILFNGINLLRVDLDGVNILVPRILGAVDKVLGDDKLEIPDYLNRVQLRRAAIHLLLSMICLPLQFRDVSIKSLMPVMKDAEDPINFLDLKRRIAVQLSESLRYEIDAVNLQMLLGGMLVLLEDLSTEEAGNMSCSSHASFIEEKHGDKIDTASGLYSQALALLCFQIVYQWKGDLYSVLFALEVLCGISKIKIRHPDKTVCKRSVRFICEFIDNQSRGRSFKEHSRLLHSLIVVAYQCLSVWLVRHPYLLYDPDCLQCVLGTLELGLSGSKSKNTQSKDGPEFRPKNQKTQNPTSQRVKHAAESLLACLMDLADAFPSPTGPDSTCTLLKEEIILKYCRSNKDDHVNFRYFWVEPGIVIGLLEQFLGNSEGCLPTVTAIIRGPFGRHAWTMQLRQLPYTVFSQSRTTSNQGTAENSRASNTSNSVTGGLEPCFVSRPKPASSDDSVEPPNQINKSPTYFPDSIDNAPKTLSNNSIPSLESVANEHREKDELDLIKSLIGQQKISSQTITDKVKKERSTVVYPNPETDCKQPSACQDFQTARLILTHLGYLSVNAWLHDSNTGPGKQGEAPYQTTNNLSPGGEQSKGKAAPPNSNGCYLPTLYHLDSSTEQFFDQLDQLDSLPTRTADTSLIFYVKKGQSHITDIVANADCYPLLSSDFHELLSSLGWPVLVDQHAGWTGDLSTSYQINKGRGGLSTSPQDRDILKNASHGLDGRRRLLYWADMSTEVAFLLPSSSSKDTLLFHANMKNQPETSGIPRSQSSQAAKSVDSSILNSVPNSVSASSDNSTSRVWRRTGTVTYGKSGGLPLDYGLYDQEIGCADRPGIVWLEAFEDWENFPIAELVGISTMVIFIHPLRTGLYRIHVYKGHTKSFEAGPLISGMVVSRRCLGSLVRQTIINANRRRRLESDYQSPHVRRQAKLHDIMLRHRMQDHSLPELFTSLLHPPISTTEPRF